MKTDDNTIARDFVLRREEAARVLGISTRTLTRLEKIGKAPPRTTISERCFGYRQSSLTEYLNQRTA